MSDWSIVVPQATTNYVTNPSFFVNITDGWTITDADASVTETRNAIYAKFGAYSLKMINTDAGDNDFMYHRIAGLTANAQYTVTAWVYVATFTAGAQSNWGLRAYDTADAGTSQGDDITAATSGWVRKTCTVTMSAAPGSLEVRLYAPQGTVYWDAIQAEAGANSTTYCDGTQPGCWWNAAPNNSTSSRSAQSRAGGRVYDLTDDFGFKVTAMASVGMGPISQVMDEYALAPGGEVQGIKEHVRVFILSGLVQGTSMANLHALRQALIDIVAPNSVPNNQPILFRYSGSAVEKEIRARYDGGLELSMTGAECNYERMAMRFLAVDPFWYEIGNSSAYLDPSDAPTLRYIAARLRSTGTWSALGLTANPDTQGPVYAIEFNPVNGLYYVGGYFFDLNNTAANIDNIASYNPSTGVWALVGAGADVNFGVSCIAIAPNGDVYLGGAFTAVGDANGNGVVCWDISAGAWVSLGIPIAGAAIIADVYDMAFDSSGNLYIVGAFVNFAGVAGADGVAKWDGATWTAVGAPLAADDPGLTQWPYAIAIDSNDHLYVGGTFTNATTGAVADFLIYWNGATWAAPGAALNANVMALLALPNDDIIVGGTFTNAGGDADADCIARWNGRAYLPLGTGMNNSVRKLALGPDGVIYATGYFTTAGSLAWMDYAAKWNGGSWAHLDVEPSGAPVIMAVCCGSADPSVVTNYDVWLGFSSTGASEAAGVTTVTNDGTANAYPVIKITRTDSGTAARLKEVRNETTGKELLFGYPLLKTETLTINLDPFNTSVVSSFYGPRPNAILKNSDVGEFCLQPGANQITCFVDIAGAPTITATMEWRDPYWSVD